MRRKQKGREKEGEVYNHFSSHLIHYMTHKTTNLLFVC